MGNMRLLRPLDPIAVAANGGSGAQNLLSPSPKEVWAAGPGYVDIDLGAALPVDTLFIGFITGAPSIVFAWQSGVAGPTERVNIGESSIYAPSRPGIVPLRRHNWRDLPGPVIHRYHRISVSGGAIGVIALGQATRTTWNREWGGGRRIIDTGSVEPLADGGFAFGDGVVKGGFRWTWGDLSDDEVEEIYALGLDRGERRPIIVAEDPDQTPGLNERIHYGLFERFEPYERAAVGKTRWSLGVLQWV